MLATHCTFIAPPNLSPPQMLQLGREVLLALQKVPRPACREQQPCWVVGPLADDARPACCRQLLQRPGHLVRPEGREGAAGQAYCGMLRLLLPIVLHEIMWLLRSILHGCMAAVCHA